ncbi:MAG: hypothetical protein NC311_13380 [Muribaculaceae bacterium]|nr:hypothetical protein [Muribaculaceae bacterium]
MAKTERQKIRDIREKYAREFAQKLKDKDAVIQRYRDENKTLQDENNKLRAGIQDLSGQIAGMRADMEKLAALKGIPPEDLEKFRASLAQQEKTGAALAELVGLAHTFRGAYI